MAFVRDRFGWICPRCGYRNMMRDNACCNYNKDTNKFCGMRKPNRLKTWRNSGFSTRQRMSRKDNFSKGVRRWKRVKRRLARTLRVG